MTTPTSLATGSQEYTLTANAVTYDLSPIFAVENALCFVSLGVAASDPAIPVTIAEVDNLGVPS